jgi:3'-phosphoadenosine 5'-phosphosulfate sulfotransferase (PAPS reductase)/FAD synthetase
MKEEPLQTWSKEKNIPYTITGIMREEGGRRMKSTCLAFSGKKLKKFQPMVAITKEWEEWFIDKFNIQICDIYKSPYNFERTGCKGCPFNRNLQEGLDTLEKYFPNERKQCEIIWKPVYEEYRRIGYRLKPTSDISR